MEDARFEFDGPLVRHGEDGLPIVEGYVVEKRLVLEGMKVKELVGLMAALTRVLDMRFTFTESKWEALGEWQRFFGEVDG